MTCPREDDVIARFLDGDVSARNASLEAHVRACAPCRGALARSRHLDALVANSTGIAGDEAAAARLLRRAIAAAKVVTKAQAAPRRVARTRVVVAAAAGFALGLMAMRWLAPAPKEHAAPEHAATGRTPREEAVPDADVAAPSTATPADDVLVLPHTESTTAGRAMPRGASAAPSLTRLDLPRRALLPDDPDLPRALAMQARARAAALGWPAPSTHALAAATAAMQFTAGRALLEGAGSPNLGFLARVIARDDDVGRALADAAAAHRGFRHRLRAAMPSADSELCSLAVRLGDLDLDRRLLARCRRDAELADTVARACARPAGQVARVGFLLDLWATVTRGGDDGVEPARDDLARASAWFAPLPASATAELLDHLRMTRSAEVRHRVFLALGARADVAALATLLAWIESPNTSAAAAAAYAAGCYDARCAPRLEEAARTSRRPELLWAALASQGHPSIRSRLRAAGLTSDEISLITSGRLRPEQIAAVASLLRGRNLMPPDNP